MNISLSTRCTFRLALAASAMLVALTASAQTPPAPPAGGPPPGPSPAKQAIDVRKAVYTLISANFRPIGGLMSGRGQYDAADIQKRLDRLVMLTEMAGEAFPEVSNSGMPDTKAKANIWTERADFDKRLKDFAQHAKNLAQVNAKEKGATDAFKAAASELGGDCKGCHDNYREK